MNRSSGNVSKTKKLISGPASNSKLSRKSFQKLSESSSISSNRNSSAQSEDEVRVGSVYERPQVSNNASQEEQDQATKKLQAKMKELKHKVRVLEESVDSKDYSLGTMAREKDRAMGEIRRLEKNNKQLRQQLNDERNYYLVEKEKFCEEMTKYKKRILDLKAVSEVRNPSSKVSSMDPSRTSLGNQPPRWQMHKEKGDFTGDGMSGTDLKKLTKPPLEKDHKSGSEAPKTGSVDSTSHPLYEGDDITLQMVALRTENAKLRSIICERDEQNYELCLRFLRMKHYKNDIRTRFQDLENEYLQVIANLMDKIDEARQEFNFIIDQKFKKPLHSTNAMYLQLVQRNSRMAFENASLRLENQCLKKELNKYMNGVSDYDRKIRPISAADDQESKSTIGNSKSESMLRRIKKNVNFKEIRTIYEREFAFKNSDTDSNYMTKSSSTVPSNGSLPDQKSSESINANQNHPLASFQGKGLPDELLNKIFKRIDTPSSQSLLSGRSKDFSKIKVKDEGATEDGKRSRKSGSSKENHYRPSQAPDRARLRDDTSSEKQQRISQNEARQLERVTRGSLPNESTESVEFEVKESVNVSPRSPNVFAQSKRRSGEVTERRESQGTRKEGKSRQEKPKPFRSRQRPRNPEAHGKDVEDERSVVELFSTPEFDEKRHEKISNQQEDKVRSRLKGKPIEDCCGLQEKFQLSDFETPPKVESKTQTSQDLSKTNSKNREKAEEGSLRLRVPESGDVCFVKKDIRKSGGSKSLIPALKTSTRRSNDILSPRAEVADAAKGSQSRHREVHSPSRSGVKQYKVDRKNSIVYEDAQYEVTEQYQEEATEIHRTPAATSRRSEGSRRFAQRLMSTSPEQIKSLLTDTQFDNCYRMAPIIVGHATTEMDQAYKFQESNNEIVLQLVLPKTTAAVEKISEDYVFQDEEEQVTVEKETSMSGLGPDDLGKTSNLEISSSDVRIPVSSLPTSSSTMEMVESAAVNERSNIMLRTLSAPGLLESGWLDSYSFCEMRDCGTNT